MNALEIYLLILGFLIGVAVLVGWVLIAPPTGRPGSTVTRVLQIENRKELVKTVEDLCQRVQELYHDILALRASLKRYE